MAIDGFVSNDAADTIEFDPEVFGTPQTIDLVNQLPTITDDLTIAGPGAELLTIDAGNGADGVFGTGDGFRIFEIRSSASAVKQITLSGLTLTGGDLPDQTAGDGHAGGAIFSVENLKITDSVISGNAAGRGSDGRAYVYGQGYVPQGRGGDGGGVAVVNASLAISRTTISDNRAGDGGSEAAGSDGGEDKPGGSGGGVSVVGGATVITDSVVTNNHTGDGLGFNAGPGFGGGIFVRDSLFGDGTLTLAGSVVSGNTSIGGGLRGYGGGVAARVATISDSDITGNESGYSAGGVLLGRNGGLLGPSGGQSSIIRSTIRGNHAYSQGGFSARGLDSLEVRQTTISGNYVLPIGWARSVKRHERVDSRQHDLRQRSVIRRRRRHPNVRRHLVVDHPEHDHRQHGDQRRRRRGRLRHRRP